MSLPFCEHCGGHDLARRPWVAADYKHPAYLAARRDAFNRSAGLCQVCGQRPAEEAHHWDVLYPAPEHMTGDYLTALCKECHEYATATRRADAPRGHVIEEIRVRAIGRGYVSEMSLILGSTFSARAVRDGIRFMERYDLLRRRGSSVCLNTWVAGPVIAPLFVELIGGLSGWFQLSVFGDELLGSADYALGEFISEIAFQAAVHEGAVAIDFGHDGEIFMMATHAEVLAS